MRYEPCLGRLSLTWVNFNPHMYEYHTASKVKYKITYTFPILNVSTVGVWEWISNFIPHIMIDAITYPCTDWSLSMSINCPLAANSYIWHILLNGYVLNVRSLHYSYSNCARCWPLSTQIQECASGYFQKYTYIAMAWLVWMCCWQQFC